MATNISKYCQINDVLLLEYEFNRDETQTQLSNAFVVDTIFGDRIFYENNQAIGITNNAIILNAIPTNEQRTSWFIGNNPNLSYQQYWTDSSINIPGSYICDTVKLHIISGYNFENIGGVLLQIGADSSTHGIVNLSNFTYIKQLDQNQVGKVLKFSPNTLFLGNKFYDKYLEFKIPSIQHLGFNAPISILGNALNVKSLSDVFITYSTISEVLNGSFNIDEIINLQLPVESVADNFNCFIAESTFGDFIEFYATWGNNIIGEHIGDIENGRIKLYTSNNPNDNFESFSTSFGNNAKRWVIIHEIQVLEQIPPATTLLTQKYVFTQDSNFSTANYFRPIIKNSDIAASFMIHYTCRLMNRMDGTQIIRRASFSSTSPKKYGMQLSKININNTIPYKVFNRVESEKANIKIESGKEKSKYIKIFYDVTPIILSAHNETFPQGTGPLFLKTYDSVYKFKFEKINESGDRVNVDLSGAFTYVLQFRLDDMTKIEIHPTYTSNMNTVIGELEFKLLETHLSILKNQTQNVYAILIKNANGTTYTLYEGKFYPLSQQENVLNILTNNNTVSQLQRKNSELQSQINSLVEENNRLKIT